jgi:hypothetical protein
VWDMLKTYWKSPEFKKISKVSFCFATMQRLPLICMFFAEESAHVGRLCMVMDMRISVFIGGGNG